MPIRGVTLDRWLWRPSIRSEAGGSSIQVSEEQNLSIDPRQSRHFWFLIIACTSIKLRIWCCEWASLASGRECGLLFYSNFFPPWRSSCCWMEYFGQVSVQSEFIPAAVTRLSVCGLFFFFFPVGDTWTVTVKWPQGRPVPACKRAFMCKRVKNAHCPRNKRQGWNLKVNSDVNICE